MACGNDDRVMDQINVLRFGQVIDYPGDRAGDGIPVALHPRAERPITPA
jgi:hypothetical protein